MFFKEAIAILSFMYCFGQNTSTYPPTEVLPIQRNPGITNIWRLVKNQLQIPSYQSPNLKQACQTNVC